jgi:hypothetical protein
MKVYSRPGQPNQVVYFDEVGNLSGENYMLEKENLEGLQFALYRYILMNALDGKDMQSIAIGIFSDIRHVIEWLDVPAWKTIEDIVDKVIEEVKDLENT